MPDYAFCPVPQSITLSPWLHQVGGAECIQVKSGSSTDMNFPSRSGILTWIQMQSNVGAISAVSWGRVKFGASIKIQISVELISSRTAEFLF